ncbi:hypothetical protein BpHYR1_004144 [Brachionus plicatilis]|uniref:Uncharacterized protein n=1 Tax=Brachionus plicatilis TaxID=10195 RepID=A0A3M7P4L1_BRAPC|nr:hypothetical protein BpHYR1_004144 [Brachionus plicatilis]
MNSSSVIIYIFLKPTNSKDKFIQCVTFNIILKRQREFENFGILALIIKSHASRICKNQKQKRLQKWLNINVEYKHLKKIISNLNLTLVIRIVSLMCIVSSYRRRLIFLRCVNSLLGCSDQSVRSSFNCVAGMLKPLHGLRAHVRFYFASNKKCCGRTRYLLCRRN